MYNEDFKLDYLYDSIDELLLVGDIKDVNNLLKYVSLTGMSSTCLIGILTVTLPAKKRLSNRPEFFKRVKEEIERRGEMKDNLLIGLE